ncbi:MAG: hypothetical protein Q9208_008650 [Pyrenodesmia sp. 3 TL-2023]
MPYQPTRGTISDTTDIISPDYQPQQFSSPTTIFMTTHPETIHHLLLTLDSERHHLQRGLNRLKYQNYWLKRGQDLLVGNEVVAPFDQRRWTLDRMPQVALETLKNEAIRMATTIRMLCEEQHTLRDANQRLREDLEARLRREEL